MKQRFLIIIAGLLLGMLPMFAQIEANGVVLAEADGEPLVGAAVQVVGHPTIGVTTDMNGRFALSVPNGAILKFSFIGMVTQELPARRNMSVVMEDEMKAIDEIIVVAYGTAKKSAFTGSAAIVKSEDLAKAQVSNPMDALVGKVSGVQINNTSGQPGQTSPAITIRGISSINAGTAPLIIVDGAPYDGDLNTISNQDIESMTVLKDAASASLYGARGANGVIMITTRKGQRGQDGSITVDAKWGATSRQLPRYNTVNSAAKYYEMWYGGLKSYAMNELGYNETKAMMFANQNLTAGNGYGLGYNVYNVPQGELMIGSNGRLNPHATLGNVVSYNGNQYTLMPDNWDDAIYRTGLRQEYTLRGTSSSEKGAYYGSVNYLNNEGITENSDYERLTVRFNADTKVKDWFKLGGNVNYAHYKGHYLTSEGSTGDSDNLFSYTQIAPIYPVYMRDGSGKIIYDEKAGINRYDYGDGALGGLVRPYLPNSNPLCSNRLDLNQNEGNAFSGTATAEVQFLKDFKFTSVNTVNLDECRFNSTVNPYYGQYASMGGVASVSHVRTFGYNFQQLLRWSHDFALHNVEVMVGHEYYRSRYFNLAANASNQYYISNPELVGAVVSGSQTSYTTDYNIEGWFGRALYSYDMRYFASLSFRRDGTSRLHPNNRWGNFFSLGGAWLISKEKWFNAKWVDELKLKASYGEQGNDNIGAYRYTNVYQIANSDNSFAIMPTTTAGNKDIKWEKNANFNAGVEFSLWRGRLTGGIEYFFRQSSDMLYALPRTPSWGYTHKWYNIGDMYNSGVEIELQGDLIKTRNLTWSMRANMSTYANRIKNMPAELKSQVCDGRVGYSNGYTFIGEGLSMYTLYMPTYAGVDEHTGKALYWRDVTDATGATRHEKTDEYSLATWHLQGTALPDVNGGFGTSLRWRGLDVSIDFSYQLGGQTVDQTYSRQMAFSRGQAFHTDLLKAWTPENTKTNVPRLQFNDEFTAAASSRFITDASYLCLQNINVGYTIDIKRWYKNINSIRVYFGADNVWLWSKRQGLDPRQSIAGGSNGEVYAPVRTITGGITINL